MAMDNPLDALDIDPPAGNGGPLEGLEPEVVDGPLGLPVLKPKGAPDPAGSDSLSPTFDR